MNCITYSSRIWIEPRSKYPNAVAIPLAVGKNYPVLQEMPLKFEQIQILPQL